MSGKQILGCRKGFQVRERCLHNTAASPQACQLIIVPVVGELYGGKDELGNIHAQTLTHHRDWLNLWVRAVIPAGIKPGGTGQYPCEQRLTRAPACNGSRRIELMGDHRIRMRVQQGTDDGMPAARIADEQDEGLDLGEKLPVRPACVGIEPSELDLMLNP